MPQSLPRPDLTEQDFEGLSSWGVRLGMASLGWITEVSLSRRSPLHNDNPRHLDILVQMKHHSWHGTLAPFTASRNEHGVASEWVQNTVSEIIDELGVLARRAWLDWPDSVPFQMPDSTLVEHSTETEYFRQYPRATVVRPERSRPTEALPGWPGQPTLREFLDEERNKDDSWLHHAMLFMNDGDEPRWKDSLNSYGQMDGFNHIDRIWRYEITPRLRRWGDIKIAQMSRDFQRLQFSTKDLSPVGAEMCCAAVKETHRSMLMAYPPTDGILPPGLKQYVPYNTVPVETLDADIETTSPPSP